MILPEQFENWPIPLEDSAGELSRKVLSDIIRRLSKEGRITATAYIQTQALIDYSGMDYAQIRRYIADVTGLLDKQVEELYNKAIGQMQADYGAEIQKLGNPSKFLDNEYVQNLIRAESLQTQQEFRNLTQSLGFNWRVNNRIEWVPIERIYQKSLDYVIVQAQSGAITIDQAIRDAVIKLSDSGLRTIDYASGYSNQIDVAVRRAAVTGMHQISHKMNELAIDELGANLVEVSAHQGARDKGRAPENHKIWQGKVYWWRQKGGEPPNGFCPDFVTTTGYGTGEGLGGWECRHSFGVFIEGVSERIWTDEQLANIDPPPFEYKGKAYKADDALDRQREIERTMRMYKRRLLGLENAGVEPTDKDYIYNSHLLTRWQDEYKKFSDIAGLRTQTERARVVGFSTGQAARARAAARRYDN